MILPWAAGSHIFFKSSIEISFNGLSLWTTTVRASKATGSSMYWTPAALQSFISPARIGRDAFWTSVSPRQNFLKPPPVPLMPTVTFRFLLAFWNSSATASVTGKTVLEPSTLTD
jgi:hypothetical protein